MFTEQQLSAITAAFIAALKSIDAGTPGVNSLPVQVPPRYDAAAAEAKLREDAAAAAAEAARKARQAKLDQMAALAAELGVPALAAAPVVAQPAPVAAAPVAGVTWHADAQGFRVDDIVAPGTPGTVTLPRTGHTISVGQPGPVYGQGEMLMGYLRRVYLQAGATAGATNTLNPLTVNDPALFRGTHGVFNPDGARWPEYADRYYNRPAYLTDAELAQSAAQALAEASHDAGTFAAMDDAYKARAGGAKPDVVTDVPISS